MTPLQQLQQFANRVHLVIKNSFVDDITGTDGQTFVSMVVEWTNMFLDELETTQDPAGNVVFWRWVRQIGFELGTATAGGASISMPSNVKKLLAGEERYVQILQGASVISNWAVVEAEQISSKTDRVVEDMCAVVGDNLVFSRAFKDTEANGVITGDIVTSIPRLAFANGIATNVKALSLVDPQQLLILGVAKSATLPDIVKGGLSPSYMQRYSDLLDSAIAKDGITALSDVAQREGLGYIGGIGFN